MTILTRRLTIMAAVILALPTLGVQAAQAEGSSKWQDEFPIAECKFKTTGRSPYFILEPGYELTLEGDDKKLMIVVLDETKTVAGVETRIVEEREWEDGELVEISRNYFAMCEGTNDTYYFGEDVDFYKNGKVYKHEGAWLAGEGENRAGLIMPGTPQPNMRYYQEIAPGVAMDRAEIISLDEVCETPAGTFRNCLKVKEGTALNALEAEYKFYAPGIGLIQDEDLLLTRHGLASQ
jgi:hypothetical protein